MDIRDTKEYQQGYSDGKREAIKLIDALLFFLSNRDKCDRHIYEAFNTLTYEREKHINNR